jgi:hypothetical protein
MKTKLLATVLLIMGMFVVPGIASAADGDLINARVRLAMETTHSAVASEGSGATDHAKRVVVVRNWVTQDEIWAARAVQFIRTQDASQLDTCTGDGIAGIESWECSANGTQAAVDNLMSAYLSVLVAAGHGG